MATQFASPKAWNDFLGRLAGQHPVFAARAPAGEKRHFFARFRPGDAYAFNFCPPAVEPLKAFFFPPREKVAEYPGPGDAAPPPGPRTIVGAKACDLKALGCLDAVFLGGETDDPFYRARREQTAIVATDCEEPDEFCFCNLLGLDPFPATVADVGLARAGEGFLVEDLSEKGRGLLTAGGLEAAPAPEALFAERRAKRRAAAEALERGNAEFRRPASRREILEKNLADPAWTKAAADCVECAACLFTCPTCHCFLLFDQGREGKFLRGRSWEACINAGYGRMAGGGTPRPRFAERFRHRFLHKFCYFPQRFGQEACSGCGRCRRGCAGKIDLRRVLQAVGAGAGGGGR